MQQANLGFEQGPFQRESAVIIFNAKCLGFRLSGSGLGA